MDEMKVKGAADPLKIKMTYLIFFVKKIKKKRRKDRNGRNGRNGKEAEEDSLGGKYNLTFCYSYEKDGRTDGRKKAGVKRRKQP